MNGSNNRSWKRNAATMLGMAVASGFPKKRRTGSKTVMKKKPRIATNIRLRSRRRRGSRTKRRRTRKSPMEVQAMDLDYQKVHLGRPQKHNLKNAWKRISNDSTGVYYRWNAINDYSSPRGFVPLDRSFVGTYNAIGYTETMPLVLYDLSVINFNSGGASTQRTGVAQQLFLANLASDSNGPAGYRYVFRATNLNSFPAVGSHQTPDGLETGVNLAANQYYVDNASGAINGVNPAGPGKTDELAWVDIRLICVCTPTIPTTYEVSIIQLMDDWLHPGWEGTLNNPGGENLQYRQLHDAFWENEVFPFISSPIAVHNPAKNHRKKVIYQTKFVLQPKETTSAQAELTHKILKIFKYFNRTQRYDWSQPGLVPRAATLAINNSAIPADGYAENNAQTLTCNVTPKARMYLMIKASHHASNSTLAVPTGPSFDIVIRKKHVQTENN